MLNSKTLTGLTAAALGAALLAPAGIAPAEVTLRSGQTVGPLAGPPGGQLLVRIFVPEGRANLTIATGGGTGDVDLYVRHGSAPTRGSYHSRSIGKATDERIVVTSPAPGWWYALIYAYAHHAGVSLTASYDGGDSGPADGALASNAPVGGLAGQVGTEHAFRIEVPAGARSLTVGTTGGSGDCDLYLRRGSPAARYRYDYRSTGKTTHEKISLTQPAAGTWHILVHGYSPFEGVTLVAAHDADSGPARRIVVDRPAASEIWEAGRTYTVTWTAHGGIREVQVQVSFDDGRTWQRGGLPAGIPAAAGRWDVLVPLTPAVETTTARIRVVDVSDSRCYGLSGQFHVRRRGHQPVFPTMGADPYENDSTPEAAKRLVLDEAQTHTLFPRGDHDWFAFSPPGAGTYVLSIPWASTELRAQIVLPDRPGRAGTTDTRQDIRTGWTYSFTVAHRVRLIKFRIWGEETSDTGRYRILVTRAGGPPHGPRPGTPPPRRGRSVRADSFESDNSRASPSAIRLGVAQARTITKDDEDWIALAGAAPGTYALRFMDVTVPLKVEVWAGLGRAEARGSTLDVPRGNAAANIVLSRPTRILKLRVRAADDDDKGSYSVSIQRR